MADEVGVGGFPEQILDTVLIESEVLTYKEKRMCQELSSGLSLKQALAKFGRV